MPQRTTKCKLVLIKLCTSEQPNDRIFCRAIGIMIIEVVLVVGFMLIAFLLGLIVASGLADTCNDLSYQSAG